MRLWAWRIAVAARTQGSMRAVIWISRSWSARRQARKACLAVKPEAY